MDRDTSIVSVVEGSTPENNPHDFKVQVCEANFPGYGLGEFHAEAIAHHCICPRSGMHFVKFNPLIINDQYFSPFPDVPDLPYLDREFSFEDAKGYFLLVIKYLLEQFQASQQEIGNNPSTATE